MIKIQNRYLIVISILALTSIVVSLLSNDIFANTAQGLAAIENIPRSFGKWKGRDVYLEPSVYEILETSSIIHRSYHSDSGDVFLSIVYYPDTKVDFHAPEACLGGLGGRVEKEPRRVQITVGDRQIELNTNQLLRKSSGYDELVLYYYKSGSYLGNSYILLRLNIALNKLFRKNASGSLIRVSTAIAPDQPFLASKRLISFIRDLTPVVIKNL